jgi:phosphoribosylaminoimidazolecarboxamide formyltransferase/IMP cyclohydrolase
MTNAPRYALISLSDKTGIEEMADAVIRSGFTILSTGGTEAVLRAAGIPVTPAAKVTGNPECFGGRMKTISFQIEGGILYDRDSRSHNVEALRHRVPRIDLVVCNLYPFGATVARSRTSLRQAVEQIDVGGPTMIRSAAKNFRHVLVVVDPSDYREVIRMLRRKQVPLSFRRVLAAKAFGHLSQYDAVVARYLSKEQFPYHYSLPLEMHLPLRYGDNPDQQAVLYRATGTQSPIFSMQRVSGRELSATNVTDVDAGLRVVSLFEEPAAAVIKHNTPCGIAAGTSVSLALTRSLDADPESAFGGVVVTNRPFDTSCVRAVGRFKEEGRGQMDIIAAPGFSGDSAAMLSAIRKTTGLYAYGTEYRIREPLLLKHIAGGMVVQSGNDPEDSIPRWTVVSRKKPTLRQRNQMRFGWKCVSRIRSNTVAVIDGTLPMTRGIGSGQTSRIRATRIALEQAGSHARGGVLVSDSFFPFDDSVKLAEQAGISAIIQQGGSVRDADSVRAADRAGIAMVFTHQRLFWH